MKRNVSGKIVCFRDLKNNVDAAIKLFSNNNPADTILREPFPVVKEKFNELSLKFKKNILMYKVLTNYKVNMKKETLY